MWAALFWNEGATRRERNGERVTGWERERLGKRESPGEVNGWNALLRLSEWAACCAGGYCRYCIEAAGVTVAVTDTKTTFHGRRHWLKAVARPLHVDHTLSINNYAFLRWILDDWQCLFSMLFAWYKRRNCTYGKDATKAVSKRCLQNFSVEFWKYMLWVFLHTWRVDYPILFLFTNLAYTNTVSEISAVMHVCCIHSEAVYCTNYKTKQKTSFVWALMLWEQWSLRTAHNLRAIKKMPLSLLMKNKQQQKSHCTSLSLSQVFVISTCQFPLIVSSPADSIIRLLTSLLGVYWAF